MKYFFFASTVILLAVTLSACRSSGPTQGSQNLTLQTFKSFSVQVPEDWRRVNKENFANTIPEETVVLFLKPVDSTGFISNANVVKESLNADVSSLEYAKANILLGSRAITDYRQVSNAEADVGAVKSVFHVFQARSSAAEPLLHYEQTYFAQDRIGYTVTCVAREDDAATQVQCESVVKSFRFVQ